MITRIPQLDALRALAVIMVLLYHFLPECGLGRFPIGWIGVDIFFVLSGFLVASILLQDRDTDYRRKTIFKNFLIRRCLRLMPAYYVFLIGYWIINRSYAWAPGEGIYYFTYLQNVLFTLEGMNNTGLNHLWSLAVEMQFYVFIPWVLLYTPGRYLVPVLAVIITWSLVLRICAVDPLLPAAHLATLGLGCLAAALINQGRTRILFPAERIYHVIGLEYIFNSQLLQYIGRISYGLYLYHKPVPILLKALAAKMDIHPDSAVLFAISVMITWAIAQISFNYLEQPFLQLKQKFTL